MPGGHIDWRLVLGCHHETVDCSSCLVVCMQEFELTYILSLNYSDVRC
jgi:hypothetical protein